MNVPDDSLWALPMAAMAVWAALILAILFVCLRVYGRLAMRVVRGEGKVWSDPLGLPDLLVIGVMGLWIASFLIGNASKVTDSTETLTTENVRDSAILFLVFAGGIIFFLQQRGISAIRLFGLRAMPPLRVLGTAALLFAAAYPMVHVCTTLMAYLLEEKAEVQKIVELFIDAVRQENWGKLVAPVIATVIIAPLTEEFLFRGYLYGVVRRYLGPIVAILLTSALFAVIHVNLLSLVSLFLLAICLALAYEATGSLLVPIVMHAMFNALNLAYLFISAYRQ